MLVTISPILENLGLVVMLPTANDENEGSKQTNATGQVRDKVVPPAAKETAKADDDRSPKTDRTEQAATSAPSSTQPTGVVRNLIVPKSVDASIQSDDDRSPKTDRGASVPEAVEAKDPLEEV